MTENFVFEPKKNPKTELQNKYYCIKGEEDFLDEDNCPRVSESNPNVSAKAIVKQDGVYRYFIKADHTGRAYNPISSLEKGVSLKILDKIKNTDYKFIEVNKRAFDMYTKFLITKNTAWFHNTEREIL